MSLQKFHVFFKLETHVQNRQAGINIVVKTGLFFKNKYKNINIKHWQIEFDEMKLHKLFFFLNQLHITLINTTCTFCFILMYRTGHTGFFSSLPSEKLNLQE